MASKRDRSRRAAASTASACVRDASLSVASLVRQQVDVPPCVLASRRPAVTERGADPAAPGANAGSEPMREREMQLRGPASERRRRLARYQCSSA